LVEPQNQGRWFVSGLASKPMGWFSPVWPQNWWRRFVSGLASKPMGRFSLVWPQIQWRRFSWFGLKTGGSFGFPDLGLKTGGSYTLVIWASKLLRRFLGLYL
jgi:hypothetical protein